MTDHTMLLRHRGLNFQLYPEAEAEDYLWVKFYSLAERDYLQVCCTAVYCIWASRDHGMTSGHLDSLQAGVPGRIIDNFAGQVKGATITQGVEAAQRSATPEHQNAALLYAAVFTQSSCRREAIWCRLCAGGVHVVAD
jgi:hypothetical protein